MSTTNPPRITKNILPPEYYGMYQTSVVELEQPKRTGFRLLRFFWWTERA